MVLSGWELVEYESVLLSETLLDANAGLEWLQKHIALSVLLRLHGPLFRQLCDHEVDAELAVQVVLGLGQDDARVVPPKLVDPFADHSDAILKRPFLHAERPQQMRFVFVDKDVAGSYKGCYDEA
jgi:hypothetical protein